MAETTGLLPVLEITSRSTKRQDEVEKPRLYASLGVQEYFQYDPTADDLNPQLQGAQLADGTYQLLPLAFTAASLPYIHSISVGARFATASPLSRTGAGSCRPGAAVLRSSNGD
ncbi:MAG: Uma2 family endonuclease [Cyanobacteria bacterium]|nr:Uma2 family endonuclease [Cyanobacteriota bacterium]